MSITNTNVSRRNFVGMSAALLGAATLGRCALAQESASEDAGTIAATSASGEAVFTPGTYTATGVGRNGDQTIEVILLEKGEIVGGNSNCCFSGILACDSQTQADLGVEGATAEAMKELQTNELAREDLVDAYVAASGETADWFTSLGVEFSANDQDPLQLTATSPVAQTSNTLVHVMYDAIRSYDTVHLYFDTEATELVQDADGRVTGVKAKVANGDEMTFSGAKGVILACGGYGKNHDLVVEYRPDLANAVTDEIAPTTGDGLRMGTAVGGVLVDMDQVDFFNHVVSGYSMLFDVPGGMGTPSGIYTNVEGKRFINEEDMIPNQYFEPILEQTDGKVFQICPVQDQVTEQVRVMLYYHMAQQADSVEELADALGIDANGLVETVNAWNGDIADGKDDEMGREENLVAIEGEVMGYQFGEAAHFFMGGLLFNTKAQIVDENEDPIPGLFGAGEVTGGMQGTTRVSGTGLMDGLVFGRIAVKTALGE